MQLPVCLAKALGISSTTHRILFISVSHRACPYSSAIAPHAFHSPLMAPMLKDFKKAVSAAKPSKPEGVTFVSTVTRKEIGEDIATAAYWLNHAEPTVRFAEGYAVAAGPGIDIFLSVDRRPPHL